MSNALGPAPLSAIVGRVLHMDSEQKWSLIMGLLFGAWGIFESVF